MHMYLFGAFTLSFNQIIRYRLCTGDMTKNKKKCDANKENTLKFVETRWLFLFLTETGIWSSDIDTQFYNSARNCHKNENIFFSLFVLESISLQILCSRWENIYWNLNIFFLKHLLLFWRIKNTFGRLQMHKYHLKKVFVLFCRWIDKKLNFHRWRTWTSQNHVYKQPPHQSSCSWT